MSMAEIDGDIDSDADPEDLPQHHPEDRCSTPSGLNLERNSILPRVCTLGSSTRPFQGLQQRSQLTRMVTAKPSRG